MSEQTDIFDFINNTVPKAINCTVIISIVISDNDFKRVELNFEDSEELEQFKSNLDIISEKESIMSEPGNEIYIYLVGLNDFTRKYIKKRVEE